MSDGRRYSLRRHVWIVVAPIALLSILFVTLGSQLDYVVREVLADRVHDAKKACGEAIRNQQGCVAIADSERVWLRVYREGELIEERDAASGSVASWIERVILPRISKMPVNSPSSRPGSMVVCFGAMASV